MIGVVKALLFDLDGVLVDTARFHFLAWSRLAEELGVPFTEEQNEQLKGISRVQSLEKILSWGNLSGTPQEKQAWMDRKNGWYLDRVNTMTPADVLPGVLPFLQEARSYGMLTAIGSASKNARLILERTALLEHFDAVVDGTHTTASKPDPEVFVLGARALETAPGQCLVVEDSRAGIEAAKRAGMFSLGIGQQEVLGDADHVVPGFEHFTFSNFINLMG